MTQPGDVDLSLMPAALPAAAAPADPVVERGQELADIRARITWNRHALSKSLRRVAVPVRAIERAGRRVAGWWPLWPSAVALIAAIWLCRRLLRRPSMPAQARQRQAWTQWLQQALALWQMALQVRALLATSSIGLERQAVLAARTPAAAAPEIGRWENEGGQVSGGAAHPAK